MKFNTISKEEFKALKTVDDMRLMLERIVVRQAEIDQYIKEMKIETLNTESWLLEMQHRRLTKIIEDVEELGRYF